MKRFLKILGALALLALGFVLLAALGLTFDYFRGKKAWEAYVAAERARGEPMDTAAFIPPPVPDEENFAMTPLLRPLFGPDKTAADRVTDSLKLIPADPEAKAAPVGGMRQAERLNLNKWRAYLGTDDLLGALHKYDAQFNELSAASRRPQSRFPLAYEKGIALPLPHLSPLMHMQKLFTLRALARLEAGDAEAAFADVETLLRLTRSVETEPLLISRLVQITLRIVSWQPIWEGLADHRWNDAQLAALQSELARLDFLESGQRAFRYEKVEGAAACLKMAGQREIYRQSEPAFDFQNARQPLFLLFKARVYQNLLAIGPFYDRTIIPSVEPATHRVRMDIVREGEAELDAVRPSILGDRFVLKLSGDTVLRTVLKLAFTQSMTDLAQIACALERHRLAHGEYPETLGALAPQYLAKLPHDVITGGPLHYRRTPDGLFVLYSVGWNGTDDGGVPATKKDGKQDLAQGDWVWRYPASR